jgi:hypothetical protein
VEATPCRRLEAVETCDYLDLLASGSNHWELQYKALFDFVHAVDPFNRFLSTAHPVVAVVVASIFFLAS